MAGNQWVWCWGCDWAYQRARKRFILRKITFILTIVLDILTILWDITIMAIGNVGDFGFGKDWNNNCRER